MGEAIHVRDLAIENVTFLSGEEATIVSITPPRVSTEGAAGEAPTEPEVITRERGE
jgi:hypothetical protein